MFTFFVEIIKSYTLVFAFEDWLVESINRTILRDNFRIYFRDIKILFNFVYYCELKKGSFTRYCECYGEIGFIQWPKKIFWIRYV